jgi:4-hydroxybenzoyl-CoA reductase subunit beta
MQVLPEFRLLHPASAAEAARLAGGDCTARFVAGGSDLVPNLRAGLAATGTLIDIAGLVELEGIRPEANGLSIGASVSLAELADDATLARDHPALVAAATSVAGPAHRAVATLGGNLCLDTRCLYYNQSQWWRESNKYCLKYRGDTCHVAPTGKRCHAAYSGDLAPALLVYGAEAEIVGPDATRHTALAELFAEDGAAHLRLAPGELIARIHLPRPAPDLRSGYDKGRLRGAIDFPLAGVAAALAREGAAISDLRVAITGTNSRPFLLAGTEALIGCALDDAAFAAIDKLVRAQVTPMRTTMIAAHYRRHLAAALALRLLRRLAGA